MKLPNARQAVVDESKVVGYLLSARHPDGRAKAAFFTAFGFHAQRWRAFARALRAHGGSGEITGISESGYGTRYIVDGGHRDPGRAQSSSTDRLDHRQRPQSPAPRHCTSVEETPCLKNMIGSCSRRI